MIFRTVGSDVANFNLATVKTAIILTEIILLRSVSFIKNLPNESISRLMDEMLVPLAEGA